MKNTKLDPSHGKQVSPFILDLLTFFILVLAGFVYLNGADWFLDISLYDESPYLDRGLSLINGFPAAELAPLYALWYYFLSLAQSDTIALYYLNYMVMTLLPVLALFVVMRGYKISRILALVLAVGFLYSPINFPTSPKVSHFVVILLLVGAFVANRSKSGVLQSAVFVLTALLAAYVRPEYFLSFLLMLGIWVIQLIRSWNGQELRNKVISVGGVIVPCLFLFLALGIPVGKRDQNMAAFR